MDHLTASSTTYFRRWACAVEVLERHRVTKTCSSPRPRGTWDPRLMEKEKALSYFEWFWKLIWTDPDTLDQVYLKRSVFAAKLDTVEYLQWKNNCKMYRNRIGSVASSCISRHVAGKVVSYSNNFGVLPRWCMLWVMQPNGPLATNTHIRSPTARRKELDNKQKVSELTDRRNALAHGACITLYEVRGGM